MAAYDGPRHPKATHDPIKETQWEIQGISKDIGKAILQAIAGLTDAAKQALEELIKQVVDTIVGYVTNPVSFLTDLAQWATRVPLLSELTNLLLGSWIPGLDASKIISGAFPLAMIQGLLDGGGKIVTGLLNIPVSIVTGLLSVGGQIVSSLIGGLDASKITSGQFNLSMINGLLDGGGKVLTSLLSVPKDIITGLFDTGAKILSSLIPGLDASKITSGSFPQAIVSGLTTGLDNLGHGIQGAINGIVNSLQGLAGNYWSQSDADQALASQAAAVAAAAAALAQLQGDNNQSNTGGVNKYADFSTYPDSAASIPGFLLTTIGTVNGIVGVKSGTARVVTNESKGDTSEFIAEFATDTDTDYQRIGAVWTGSAQVSWENPSPFFTPSPWNNPYTSWNCLYFRYKDYQNWIRARFIPGGTGLPASRVLLECSVAGVVTQLGPAINHVFQPNTAYWANPGNAGGPNIHQIFCGNTPILTYTDSGALAQLGATFRGAAFGGRIVGPRGFGTAVNPGPVIGFAVQDNLISNYLGKQARWYRNGTGTVAASTASDGALIPSGLINVVDYNVGGIYTFDPASNCKVTVSEAGLYRVNFAATLNADVNVFGYLWKNGTFVKRGSAGRYWIHSSWDINLAAGDYIQVGGKSIGAASYFGDAAGQNTYLEIRQILGVK